MLFIPNLIWLKRQPDGYKDVAKNENKVLLAFERIGQVLVVVSTLIFINFNVCAFSPWTAWLIISFCLMLVYETCWVRYFIEPTLNNFYGKFLFIPVPLASLPIAAFLLLGIYGKVIWLIISVVILGVGHIGIHIQHLKNIKAGTTKRGNP
jgi:hypothetical protein